MQRKTLKQRITGMSLCARLSALFTAIALAVSLGVAFVTGETHGLKLAAAILLFVGVAAALELFFPTGGASRNSPEAN